jgi:hypothetical protein
LDLLTALMVQTAQTARMAQMAQTEHMAKEHRAAAGRP